MRAYVFACCPAAGEKGFVYRLPRQLHRGRFGCKVGQGAVVAMPELSADLEVQKSRAMENDTPPYSSNEVFQKTVF